MFKFCLFCFAEIKRDIFCDQCHEAIKNQKKEKSIRLSILKGVDERHDINVTTIYNYLNPLREMVLRAKVKNDHRMLESLVNLLIEEKTTIDLANWADCIMPATSSFWGRLRGRFDIAYMMVLKIAKVSGKPLMSAPFKLHWRLKKRALQKKKKRGIENETSGEIIHREGQKNQKILLVDDIITTGFTLMNLAKNIENKEIRAIALCNAMTK